jgi:hypothetical protein
LRRRASISNNQVEAGLDDWPGPRTAQDCTRVVLRRIGRLSHLRAHRESKSKEDMQ